MSTPLKDAIAKAAQEQASLVDPVERADAPDAREPSAPSHTRQNMARAFYLSALASDVASTAYFQSHPQLEMHEGNPLINKLPVGAQLPVGGLMEAGAVLLGNRLLKNHPAVRDAMMLALGGVHGGLSASNIQVIRARQRALDQRDQDVKAAIARRDAGGAE